MLGRADVGIDSNAKIAMPKNIVERLFNALLSNCLPFDRKVLHGATKCYMNNKTIYELK